ncbi:hypothetical protein [Arthrobacter dokdonensis]|uniref:hypothetical protein n=1 Tax=Arthrobacter dokdonellae TaxID=2211210 RepID=UPI001D130B9B|nr:hypothetical protein [Arthrobacter dokdonellae]
MKGGDFLAVFLPDRLDEVLKIHFVRLAAEQDVARAVTEAEIDRWVEEARAGYNVEGLKTRMGRPARGAAASQAVPVRLATEEIAAAFARAGRENLIRPEAFGAALSAWAQGRTARDEVPDGLDAVAVALNDAASQYVAPKVRSQD